MKSENADYSINIEELTDKINFCEKSCGFELNKEILKFSSYLGHLDYSNSFSC